MYGHGVPPSYVYGKGDVYQQSLAHGIYNGGVGPDMIHKHQMMMGGGVLHPMMNIHPQPMMIGGPYGNNNTHPNATIPPPINNGNGDTSHRVLLPPGMMMSQSNMMVSQPNNIGPSSNMMIPQHNGLNTSSSVIIPNQSMMLTTSSNDWGMNLNNQYGNNRLAVYIENNTISYELVESDLRELFSYYSGVHGISISNEYPAAELIVTDPNCTRIAIDDLDGIILNGIGTLRCVLLKPGETLNGLFIKNNKTNLYNNDRFTNIQSHNRISDDDNIIISSKTRPLYINGVEHVIGITNKKDIKRMCRFELIELFSYEPDFDVTGSILGINNTNIEYIMKNSNNKVDLTIKGKPLNSAPVSDRLHLSVSSNDFNSYNKALYMVEDLLTSVCEKYVSYVKNRGKIVSNLVGFRRHEYEEDDNGILDYKGFIDKPKTWLDFKSNRNLKGNIGRNFKKIDRNRIIRNKNLIRNKIR